MKLPFAAVRPMLAPMNELDEVWTLMVRDASEKADVSGRRHVADYLRLRATNDAIRSAGVDWLIESMIETATGEQCRRQGITIEREDPHRFARGSSTMVGTLIEIRQGVRCLTVEAGWARTPTDGIMQHGSLAYARVSHFGMSRENTELRLIHGEDLPEWLDEAG